MQLLAALESMGGIVALLHDETATVDAMRERAARKAFAWLSAFKVSAPSRWRWFDLRQC